MPATSDALFTGVTMAEDREMLVHVWRAGAYTRMVAPCVGRFGSVSPLVADGMQPTVVEASDISLFSAVIGFLVDPQRSVHDLKLRVPDLAEAPLIGDPDSDLDWAAGVLLTIRYAQMSKSSLYAAGLRAELRRDAKAYRQKVKDSLAALVFSLSGCRFEVADMRTVLDEVAKAGPEVLCFADPPTYKAGYTKLFSPGEALFGWHVEVAEFAPDEKLRMLEQMAPVEATVATSLAAYEPTTLDQARDLGWVAVMGRDMGAGKTRYLLTNHDPGERRTHASRAAKAPHRYPMFADQPIGPDSQLSMVAVDKDTGLYYRDLLVKRLPESGGAELNGLLLVDGRVVAAFGMFGQRLRLGKADRIEVTYGVNMVSDRYEKLGKLFAMAITSGDMLRWLHRVLPYTQIVHEPVGVVTTVLTVGRPESKTNRGVMKLRAREEKSPGEFRLRYEADWRNDTWADVVAEWHRRFAHHHRRGWACDECHPEITSEAP